MLRQFKDFIEQQSLFQPDHIVLLAVSGGVDSVIMAELFHRAGYRFGVVHANFQLRGEESDQDERFVESLATRYTVPFYSTRFYTANFADSRNVSIQMAARELRYEWFEEIRRKEGFDWIATAHHLDDQVETFFINLIRGTGISGLHGIPVRNDRVIRPLLFARREEISGFAREQEIPFREDSTNSSTKYFRNRIRHQLLPLLLSIEPDYARQITDTISRIRETESILNPYLEETRARLIRQEQNHWIIRIADLRNLVPLSAWLYELLVPFGFHPSTIQDLIHALDQDSGKTFLSPTYRIIKDRDRLIITRAPSYDTQRPVEEYLIGESTGEIRDPVHLTFQTIHRHPGYLISADPNRATLDRKKLSFPLTLRRWSPGDYFYPLGMTKRKKLSDFFIDEKISIPEKETCWLLCSGNRIVWVIGRRIDHWFRVSTRSNELLVVDFLP